MDKVGNVMVSIAVAIMFIMAILSFSFIITELVEKTFGEDNRVGMPINPVIIERCK